MTEKQKEKIEFLKEIIKRHNFYYETSSDLSVRNEGALQREMMLQLCLQIPACEVPKLIWELPERYRDYIYENLMFTDLMKIRD